MDQHQQITLHLEPLLTKDILHWTSNNVDYLHAEKLRLPSPVSRALYVTNKLFVKLHLFLLLLQQLENEIPVLEMLLSLMYVLHHQINGTRTWFSCCMVHLCLPLLFSCFNISDTMLGFIWSKGTLSKEVDETV